jgi:hypothetical protein
MKLRMAGLALMAAMAAHSGVGLAQGMMGALKPDAAFDSAKAPPAPDYRQDATWAGLPDREDAVDVLPDGSTDGQAAARVDVFFVHPTTYFGKDGWNAAWSDQGGAGVAGVDAGTMRAQASAFNGCCRVFAPRYRQATLYSFFGDSADGHAAINLAYGDVSRAFDDFLRRIRGRPFILAGHSQGSIHLIRLLQERVIGTPLQKRLVAAYAIGASVPKAIAGKGLPLCASAAQTGCLVVWNTVNGAQADSRRTTTAPVWWDGKLQPIAGRAMVCTNPLNWTLDGAADASANLGAVHGVRGGPLGAPMPGFTGAHCDAGLLVVDDLRAPFVNPLTKGGVYHIYDYNLFYMNLRANAVERAGAYLKR